MRTESECTETELRALIAAMTERPSTYPHLEIGTAAGGTLKRMMLAYSDAERPRFVVIDPMGYFPGQREAIEANLASVGLDPSGVEFRVKTSSQALGPALRAKERFDFILIDGNHALRAVTEDLRWTRLLTSGGHVCLHDYEERPGMVIAGVKIAVDAFLARYPNYQLREVAGAMAILKKIEAGPSEIGWPELAAARTRQWRLRWGHSLQKRFGQPVAR